MEELIEIPGGLLSKSYLGELYNKYITEPFRETFGLKKSKEKTVYCDAIIQNYLGQLLILQRSYNASFGPGKWSLPGGHLDPGETIQQGAERELDEETDIIADLEFLQTAEKDDCIIHYFTGNVTDPQLILDNDEHYRYAWINTSEIPDYDFLLDLGTTLSELFPMDFFPMDFLEETEENNLELTDELDKNYEIVKSEFEKGNVDTDTFLDYTLKYNELKKGGEGSRGGKVIGHTKSGKPIYDTFNHPDHKDFTKEDHEDADITHANIGNTLKRNSSDWKHHWNEGGKHYDSSKNKMVDEPDFKIDKEDKEGFSSVHYSNKEFEKSEITDEEINELIKGVRAQVGEVRTWGTEKWVKHSDGWVHLNEKGGKHILERPGGKREEASPEHIDFANEKLEELLKNALPVGTKITVDGKPSEIKSIEVGGSISYQTDEGLKTEKEIGILPGSDGLIDDVNESTRFIVGKELFGKQEGEETVSEEIEKEVDSNKTAVQISEFETRSGEKVNALDYTFVKPVDIQLIDQDKVLGGRPFWCPVINEKIFYGFKDNNFAFDYVKLDDNKLLLATNGFEKKSYGGDIGNLKVTNEELKNDIESIPYHERYNIVKTINDSTRLYSMTLNGKKYSYQNKEDLKNDEQAVNNNQESEFAVVSVEQLVAIQDFYTKKRKADIDLHKQKKTQRNINRLKEMIGTKDMSKYSIWSYSRLSDKQKKKYSEDEWNSIPVEEKYNEIPFMKTPPVELGKGTRITPMDDNHMWVSNFNMYKKFVDKQYLTPNDKGKRNYDENDVCANEYKEVRNLLKWKKLDLNIQREENGESYKKGFETSYGESGTSDILLDTYGVKVKSQNGKPVSVEQIEQIGEALKNVYKTFGDRSSMAKKSGLKISHSGEKLMFARNALGLFVPSMNAIGVSNNSEHDKFGFTLAHEYSHFVDNYLGKTSNRNFASDNHNSTAGKIAYKFRELMHKKGFGDTDYANRTCECFARALEQYHAGSDTIKSKKTGLPYHQEDGHVNKPDFENHIQPLIHKFFSENDEILKSLYEDGLISDLIKSKDKGSGTKKPEDKKEEEEPTEDEQRLGTADPHSDYKLKKHARAASEESLNKTIKGSGDEKLRKIAHKELDRRKKEEHIKDEKEKAQIAQLKKPLKKGEENFFEKTANEFEKILDKAVGDENEPVEKKPDEVKTDNKVVGTEKDLEVTAEIGPDKMEKGTYVDNYENRHEGIVGQEYHHTEKIEDDRTPSQKLEHNINTALGNLVKGIYYTDGLNDSQLYACDLIGEEFRLDPFHYISDIIKSDVQNQSHTVKIIDQRNNQTLVTADIDAAGKLSNVVL